MITTAEARLFLYNFIERCGTETYYTDTDSIVYRVKSLDPKDDPLFEFKNDYLGGLTNEIGRDWEILDFQAPGAKQYSFKKRNVVTGEIQTVTKLRGITLDMENASKFSHDTMARLTDEMLQNRENIRATSTEIVSVRPELRKHSYFRGIQTIIQEKKYRTVNGKGVLQSDGRVVPFGYSGIES